MKSFLLCFIFYISIVGHVHCDPHPANVLLRVNPKTKEPQLVLVDHGLYKQIDDDFRLTYARLWKGLMLADIPQIQESCLKLGVSQKMVRFFL